MPLSCYPSATVSNDVISVKIVPLGVIDWCAGGYWRRHTSRDGMYICAYAARLVRLCLARCQPRIRVDDPIWHWYGNDLLEKEKRQ